MGNRENWQQGKGRTQSPDSTAYFWNQNGDSLWVGTRVRMRSSAFMQPKDF